MVKINIKSLDKSGIYRLIEDLGLPRYRGDQLLLWMYQHGAGSIDEITEFSKDLRARLRKIAYISALRMLKTERSSDGTEKFLFELEDGQTIESVFIPEDERRTLCISSQVGCAMGCLFCRTGASGFVRNLKSDEIVDQIIAVNRIRQAEPRTHIRHLKKGGEGGFSERKITNVVLMGMGEPLANFDEVVDALWRMVGLLGISKRRITLSTVGIIPQIVRLAKEAPDVNLAISLNATTDEVRNRLMPVNKRYPIHSLMNACRRHPLSPGRRITFEYVMIDSVNDSLDDAQRLADLLTRIRCKVNLIPLNPFPGCPFKRSPFEKILAFQNVLKRRGIRAFIRESRGQDISAACGQLRAAIR